MLSLAKVLAASAISDWESNWLMKETLSLADTLVNRGKPDGESKKTNPP